MFSYNYFLILEVHVFNSSQEFCYRKILNNKEITTTLAEFLRVGTSEIRN